MVQAAWKSYVYAHIISRVIHIMPFVAGHKIKIQKTVKNIWVKAAKFIYDKNTRKLSYSTLFDRVGFPRYEYLIKCSAAIWMQKIKYSLEPGMIA